MHHVVTAALNKLSVVILAGGLLAIAAGVASAAIPSADGTIYACYDKQSGQVRIVDPASSTPKPCTAKEVQVSWNVEGAAGQDGVSGYQQVYAQSTTNSIYDKTKTVFCPSGTKVIGGGAGVYGPMVAEGQLIVDGVGIVQSHPFNETGWGARAEEFVPTDDDWYLAVWVICADVS